jgi:hypothetical protein
MTSSSGSSVGVAEGLVAELDPGPRGEQLLETATVSASHQWGCPADLVYHPKHSTYQTVIGVPARCDSRPAGALADSRTGSAARAGRACCARQRGRRGGPLRVGAWSARSRRWVRRTPPGVATHATGDPRPRLHGRRRTLPPMSRCLRRRGLPHLPLHIHVNVGCTSRRRPAREPARVDRAQRGSRVRSSGTASAGCWPRACRTPARPGRRDRHAGQPDAARRARTTCR